MFLSKPSTGTCWICGSPATTHEHKFKASDIRRLFGSDLMFVHRNGDDIALARAARGPRSAHLKYSSPICERCNSATTQESDRAYDKFITHIENEGATESAISSAFSLPEFQKSGESYIPLFRYFAKLIGCHLADIDAPIPTHLSKFVRKASARNCIWLATRPNPEIQRRAANGNEDDTRYAAHGGLVVITKEPKLRPVRLHTTLSVGAIQFVFTYVYTIFEKWEMLLRYQDFVEWCAKQAKIAKESPLEDIELDRLGL